ncbi:MAG: hypothetical protein AB7S78_12155 [Candidatus Omnitrophota bacterium]
MTVFFKNCFKFVLGIFLGAFVIAGLLYVLLNRPYFYQIIVPRLVESLYPNTHIDELRVGRAEYKFPDQFKFKNVETTVTLQNKKHEIGLINLDLIGIVRFLAKRGHLDVSVSVRSFSTEDLDINYSDLEFSAVHRRDQTIGLTGRIFISQGKALEYLISDADIKISGDLNRLNFDLSDASFYGGKLGGEISLENISSFPYQVGLRFDHISSERLNEVYGELYSNFRGLISGTLRLTGDAQNIESFVLVMESEAGAEIKAWVVGWMIDFVPAYSVVLSKDLKDVIKQNRFLTADYIILNAKNANQKVIEAKVEMKIRKYNLKPNYTFDINIDRDLLESLLGIERFLKTGGFNVPR